MSVFTISDLHLSTLSSTNKSMEVFGRRWQDYTHRLEVNWTRLVDENKAERKVLVVSTASPYKFANDVFRAITGKYPENEISALTELQTLSNVKIPAPLENLDKKSVLHTQIIEKTQMADATLTFAKN